MTSSREGERWRNEIEAWVGAQRKVLSFFGNGSPTARWSEVLRKDLTRSSNTFFLCPAVVSVRSVLCTRSGASAHHASHATGHRSGVAMHRRRYP